MRFLKNLVISVGLIFLMSLILVTTFLPIGFIPGIGGPLVGILVLILWVALMGTYADDLNSRINKWIG